MEGREGGGWRQKEREEEREGKRGDRTYRAAWWAEWRLYQSQSLSQTKVQ